MTFLGSVGSFLGFGGRKSGGTPDATKVFDQYKTEIQNLVNQHRENLRYAGQNPVIPALLGHGERSRAIIDRYATEGRASVGRLTDALLSGAGTAASSARTSGLEAARVSAGGRRGLAFGGGAGAIGARIGAQSATERAGLLQSGLLQSAQQNFQLDQNILSGRLSAENSGLQATLSAGNLIEMMRDRQDRISLAELQSIAGLAGNLSGVGLQNDSRAADRRFSMVNSLLSGASGS